MAPPILTVIWSFFDEVFLFDTSAYRQKPALYASIENGKLFNHKEIPAFLRTLIPKIINLND